MAASWDGESDGVSDEIKAKSTVKTEKIARKTASKIGCVSPGLKTKLLFLMMRAFQMKNNYAPLDKEYWINKKWFGKERPWKHTE